MRVLPFTEDNLALAFSNKYSSSESIKDKSHFEYFKGYLGEDGLNAKSILIEENYVSKDYLDDYTFYYATCHEDYSKFCKRIHFFDLSFSEIELKAHLFDLNTNNPFWESYLGFIVVKPIPLTVIGYTVLKTYLKGEEFDQRNFWGTRDYVVHLYGKALKINSLAFQEQDSVLAACATTAIWSMLNKASIDYHTILKSPGKITQDADKMASDGSRLFPNTGLNLLQICQAIYNSGLVSEIKEDDEIIELKENELSVVPNDYTKKIINAYSSIGIPLILIIHVPNDESYGLHAIAVSGYKKKAPSIVKPQNETSWLSENIEKIYAHDDQWGPFVRITFQNEFELDTPWSYVSDNYRPVYVSNIVVPIFPKIRISYENIESIVLGLDTIFSLFFENKILGDLVWDIKINFSENFKEEIRLSYLDDDLKFEILKKGLPKYIWIASCYINGIKVFDFTFDATNVKNAMIGIHVICHFSNEIKNIIADYFESNRKVLEPLISDLSMTYYDLIIENLKS